MSTQQVRVTLSITVNVEDWIAAYGDAPEQVRERVKAYVLSAIQNSAASDEGGFARVVLR